jgi:DNA polymerase-3 subunit beta
MKITANRPALLTEIQLVARAASTRSTIQAMSGVLVETNDTGISLAATDTELALRSKLDVEVEKPGKILLPARLLVEILRALDGESVTLEHKPDKGHVAVSSQRAEFDVRILPADDFPRLPELESNAMTLAATVFAETIDRVAKAASRDETRPVLTGILVSVEDGQLRMVATDSYRLSVKETPLADVNPFEANIPARTLQEAGRLIKETAAEQVSVVSSENQIVFEIGRVILSSRLIDGQFPNYQRLLPDSYEHEIHVSRAEMLGVVRRIGLMAQRNSPLRLRFETGSLVVSAQTPDVGEAVESLPINYQGEQLEIGFNAGFLQDGLESVESDELQIKLISPVRPGLIEAASGAASDATAGDSGEQNGASVDETSGGGATDRFLYLIMPVRLNV